LVLTTAILCLSGVLVTASPAFAVKGVETRLFFGLAIPETKQPCNNILTSVTDQLWETFVARYIVGRFPDGFTVAQATGHWKDQTTGNPVSENSRVLILVAEKPEEQKIETLIQIYLALFCQDTVLRIDNAVIFDFVAER
jgi:hypothetical protein